MVFMASLSTAELKEEPLLADCPLLTQLCARCPLCAVSSSHHTMPPEVQRASGKVPKVPQSTWSLVAQGLAPGSALRFVLRCSSLCVQVSSAAFWATPSHMFPKETRPFSPEKARNVSLPSQRHRDGVLAWCRFKPESSAGTPPAQGLPCLPWPAPGLFPSSSEAFVTICLDVTQSEHMFSGCEHSTTKALLLVPVQAACGCRNKPPSLVASNSNCSI